MWIVSLSAGRVVHRFCASEESVRCRGMEARREWMQGMQSRHHCYKGGEWAPTIDNSCSCWL